MKNRTLVIFLKLIFIISLFISSYSCFIFNDEDDPANSEPYQCFLYASASIEEKETETLVWLLYCLKSRGFLSLPNKNFDENKENDELEKSE